MQDCECCHDIIEFSAVPVSDREWPHLLRCRNRRLDHSRLHLEPNPNVEAVQLHC